MDSVEFFDLDCVDFTKRIDTFLLLACFAGFQDYANGENFTESMLKASQNNIRICVCCDGHHLRNEFGAQISIQDAFDSIWSDWRNDKSKTTQGFIKYSLNPEGGYSSTPIGMQFDSVRSLLEAIQR